MASPCPAHVLKMQAITLMNDMRVLDAQTPALQSCANRTFIKELSRTKTIQNDPKRKSRGVTDLRTDLPDLPTTAYRHADDTATYRHSVTSDMPI